MSSQSQQNHKQFTAPKTGFYKFGGLDEQGVILELNMNKTYSLEELREIAKQQTFQRQQDKIEFFNSEEFKQAERQRRERSKPTEHIVRGFNRVWCPVYERERPEWLCANECNGDLDEPDRSDFDG